MGLLDNKVAFITGGASGIGEGTARRFIEESARVVVADVNAARGQAICEELGSHALHAQCDVSVAASVKAALEQAVNQFGRLDIVFANAGINGVWAPIDELEPEEWSRTLDVNLKGTYLTLHYAIPHLKQTGAGSIIITSSVNGNRVFSTAGASAYSTSKAGQITLMRMAALELGRHHIRCNAVCPGPIRTNIGESTERRGTDKLRIKIEMPEGSPAINNGRGVPKDVADTCLFLASDLSRHVSGVEIYVDGGDSLMR